MRSENHSRTWNIFETIETFGLLCAVPAEMPLPAFLISSDWRYQCQGSDDSMSWAYLQTPTAIYGAHTNGFYLFMPTTIAGYRLREWREWPLLRSSRWKSVELHVTT